MIAKEEHMMKAELYPDDNIDIRTYYSTPRRRPWIKWVVIGCILLLLAVGIFSWYQSKLFYPDIILENDQLYIFEYEGQIYLRFHEGGNEALMHPGATVGLGNSARISEPKPSVEFASVEEMYDALKNGTLTDLQVQSAKRLPRNKYGIYMFDIEKEGKVAIPPNTIRGKVIWYGTTYSQYYYNGQTDGYITVNPDTDF